MRYQAGQLCNFVKYKSEIPYICKKEPLETVRYLLSALLIILSLLPLVKNPHWFFRVPEFFKIQIFFMQLLAVLLLIIFYKPTCFGGRFSACRWF